MIRHYITIALRVFRRQKLYSIINVLGLSIGIAVCTLIFLYVQDELTFDDFHENGDRIVRVNAIGYEPDGSVGFEQAWQPWPLAEGIAEYHPDVEATTRLYQTAVFIRTNDEPINSTVMFVDSTFFRMFSFELLEGDPGRVLREPTSILLTETAAIRHFGSTDVVGNTLDIRFEGAFETVTVEGLVADPPTNSSIPFEYLLPFHSLTSRYQWMANRPTHWLASTWPTYAMLLPGTDLTSAQESAARLRAQFYPDELSRWQTERNWTADFAPRSYRLQPLEDIHLDPTVRGGIVAPSDPTYSFILGGIAALILLLACINYTTLAIGRSARRTAEIGLRKSVGAGRRQILAQFGGEALVFGALGVAGALILVEFLLPVFNELAGKNLNASPIRTPIAALSLAGIGLVASLLAGAYPAVLLSGLRPSVMLGRKSSLGGSGVLSKALVVTQFTLSIALIAGTLVMREQMTFIQERDLGFDRSGVVVVPLNDVPHDRVLAHFRNELVSRPEIEDVSGVNNSFSRGWSREGWDYKDEEKRAYVYNGESNFADVMGFTFVAGRNYNPAMSTDSTDALIVNEAFARDFGWTPQEAIGQRIDGFYEEPEIVGVFKDANFLSLHNEVEPMAVTMVPEGYIGNVLVRADLSDPSGVVDLIESAWNEVAAGVPMQYSFLEDDIAAQYESEKRWNRIVSAASAMAILIACLGLFGLATLTVTNRTKEIGIRKVLGASARQIFGLLTREYGLLIGVSLVLSVPLTVWAASTWLEDFAYRIEIGAWPFLLTALVAGAIALISISYQAIRASNANPVESLRHE